MAKKVVKKVAAKKVAAKTVAKRVVKSAAVKIEKALNKAQLIELIASRVALPRKIVESVFVHLFDIAVAHLKRRGPGEFTLPNIAKLRVINKPATKARKGINPFNGEPITFAAKPARSIIRIKPLKKIKDGIN